MRREDGSAIVEVVALGFLLVVPLVSLLMALSDVHRAALAATAAAREAGFEAARSTGGSAASGAASDAVAQAISDEGLDPSRARLRLAGVGTALTRGSTVQVVVEYPVPVIRIPFWGGLGPSLWVRARHVARVDPYRSRP